MRLRPRLLGRLGEWVARVLYLLRGYRIVGCNVRSAAGEIDLVVRRGRMLVVAEVKTRQSLRAGEGFEAVDRRKRQRLVRLAEELLSRQREPLQVRYDIVSVRWTGWWCAVRVIEDAFRPVGNAQRPWEWEV
jgi:putative endonuclease